MHEPELGKLVTLASHGYKSGTGSEVALGQGVIGLARARHGVIANLQMLSYARSVHRTTGEAPDEIKLPGLPNRAQPTRTPIVSPAVLIGVLAIESNVAIAYDELDERVLTVAARLVAAGIQHEQMALSDATNHQHRPRPQPPSPTTPSEASRSDTSGAPIVLRHYTIDGSTFLGDQYVIKGVAGRLLWKVVSEQVATGGFIHQPGGEAGQDARAARVPADKYQERDPAQATARRARRADPHPLDRSWPLRR